MHPARPSRPQVGPATARTAPEHLDRETLVAVSAPLAQASGAPVDVLDAHGVELARAGIETVAIVRGVHDLVQERRGGIARDRPPRIAVAARLERRVQGGIPGDRSRRPGRRRGGAFEQVAGRLHAGADLVARPRTVLDPCERGAHLGRFPAGIDARPDAVERGGDASGIGRVPAGEQFRPGNRWRQHCNDDDAGDRHVETRPQLGAVGAGSASPARGAEHATCSHTRRAAGNRKKRYRIRRRFLLRDLRPGPGAAARYGSFSMV